MTNLTHDWGFLALSGPRSRDILAGVTDCDLSNEAFPWLAAREARVAGRPCLLMRVSFTGELGWELHMPRAGMAAIFDALHEAGARFGLLDIGSHALNALRMEKAHPGGNELTPEVGLVEAGMLRFFKPDKPPVHRPGGDPRSHRRRAVDAAGLSRGRRGRRGLPRRRVRAVRRPAGGDGQLRRLRTPHEPELRPCLRGAAPGPAAAPRWRSSFSNEARAATVLNGPAYDPTNRRLRS